MLKIEDAEIGMEVMTKNNGAGVLVDFRIAEVSVGPGVHAIVRTRSGDFDCPLFWLSRLGEKMYAGVEE